MVFIYEGFVAASESEIRLKNKAAIQKLLRYTHSHPFTLVALYN